MVTRYASSYDEIPYLSEPFPQTHPIRLAAVAWLLAMDPVPPRRCRVLELGCAAGGNLLPLAVSLPEARLVGVDLSRVQVAEGAATLERARLDNVRLLQRSIADVDETLGEFDYVIAHGVYSWVPDAVQEKILSICARQLSANGIAYVSYNTLPGWHMRGMIRDLMRFHAMQFAEPTARVPQARAILDFLARCVPEQSNAWGVLLKSELEQLRRSPDHYIFHEHLEDVNEPVYFHQFMERAARHGLQYLAEADFGSMLASTFPAGVADTLRRIAPDLVRQEQLMDFLRNRTFRQTLLVRSHIQLDRVITPERVEPLYMASPIKPDAATPDITSERTERFSVPGGGVVTTPVPITKAALVMLSRYWPAAVSFKALLAEARGRLGRSDPEDARLLASEMLQCYTAGLLELQSEPFPFSTQPSERPLASPLARCQARSGRRVTNLRHESVELSEPLRRLLARLDGRRNRAELRRAVTASTVEQGLSQLARAALLIG